MFFNIRFPLVLLLASFFGLIVGALLKIHHWVGASTIFASVMTVQGIAIVWMVIILLVKKRA